MEFEFFISFCFGMLQLYFQQAAAEGNFCGTATADPEKTCISVRLPWQPEPIYFCVEKDKFKYRKESTQFGGHHYCGNENNEKTLMVATPWDTCPLSSNPDHCVHITCPSQPFNRTCTSLSAPENDSFECCDKYFCEDGKQDDCKFRILEPQCSIPKNKTNCVAFIDSHGCCPKYQCDGEGKEGTCPMSSNNRTYGGYEEGAYGGGAHPSKRHRMDATPIPTDDNLEIDTDSSISTPPSVQASDASVSSSGGRQPAVAMAVRSPYPSRYRARPNYSSQVSCVGDYNCPGTMKCCSYLHEYPEPLYPASSVHAIRGYCVEPAAE